MSSKLNRDQIFEVRCERSFEVPVFGLRRCVFSDFVLETGVGSYTCTVKRQNNV